MRGEEAAPEQQRQKQQHYNLIKCGIQSSTFMGSTLLSGHNIKQKQKILINCCPQTTFIIVSPEIETPRSAGITWYNQGTVRMFR